MKKLIILALMALLMSLTGYSQTLILNNPGDTSLAFPLTKAKYLLKEAYRAKSLDSLLFFKNKECTNYREIIKNDSINKLSLLKINANNNEVLTLQKKQIGLLMTEVKAQMKAVRRQKIYKVVGTLAGTALGAYCGFKTAIVLNR